ncbi:DUF1542 domain-containing protein [Fructobacillus sp. CRL 2054]|uniref:DUF1542 domain-containing protein n=1 Tax=Fructobacillus sp. CRL 2054 TaxID=2763007 RepID=UPI002379A9C0|nr:DUF1542 domain-containing protein [Fructobacillus sp. CRL 2054]MDD9139090.1 DUF1542 domain-containing protein [Fructobacillus sp. CRL 2054]
MAKAQVEQIEKDKAKAAIDKAAEEANALIDGLKWDATNAKDQAEKAKAQAAIQNDVDQAKQKIQNGSLAEVPGNRDEGIAQIQRDAAKAAIDKAVAEAQDKLANNDKLNADVKEEQQTAIDKAADNAKSDINNAQDKTGIDNAVDSGKNAINDLSNIIVLPTTGGETRKPAAVPTPAVSTNSEVVATPTVASEPARTTTTQSETPATQIQTQTEVPAASEATQAELPKTTEGKKTTKSSKPTKTNQATKSVKEPEHDNVIFNSFLGAVVASLAGWRGFVWFAKKKEEDEEQK